MSRKYMNEKWCVRCGRKTPTPFLVKCAGKIGDVHGKNVLDIGCGNGRNSVYMQTLGANVYAFDMNDDFGTKIVLGHDKIPRPDACMDIIMANYVLMFLDKKEQNQVFHEVRRLLKPDGYFIWELYPAKDSNYPTQDEMDRLISKIVKTFTGMKIVTLNKNKGMFRCSSN
jgi:ubiquinone/menaquinone biosynthesis C-methylase UbiE